MERDLILNTAFVSWLNLEHKFFWSDILSSASVKFGISSFLQLLQFDICVQFLQLFWYFIFP